ncbi:mediator of RNA polymerase II transcription subunit 12-like isoform X1 [Cucumis melo var. makuwa]|uniref:Mediator of RNA polymerase II transcription subunit 12-like isoform X1 n=1 Tax=Cucumis melo var. makuwa TaxID=1194695 RepID=A0A5D3CL33_CUCMM|nr:mediator of RNA polymerase II transcription subunit 12-like isoform X1 [Cucumis melo var. makuwa]
MFDLVQHGQRSNNARLHDVADDPQQVLDICNNNERSASYDTNTEQTGYGSPMTMMPTFGAGFCDSEVGTGYYDAGMYQIDKSTNENQRTKRTKNNIEFRVDVDN